MIEDGIAYIGGTGLVHSGGVYIYEFQDDNWLIKQILKSPDGISGDSFGHKIAVSGEKMLVSSIGYDHTGISEAGAVYAFEFDGMQWQYKQKIIDFDSTTDRHRFGFSISISDDLVVIGAPGDSSNVQSQGTALIYQYEQGRWTLKQRIFATDGEEFDRFGIAVKIDGGDVFVGAPNHFDVGAVYAFKQNDLNWYEDQKIQPPVNDFAGYFGGRLDFENGNLAVSAMFTLMDSGAVYIYKSNNGLWVEQQKLTASDIGQDDDFGSSVKLSGNKMIVGAWGDDDMASGAGAAYLFEYDGSDWAEIIKLTAADGAALDRFGRAADIDGEKIIVGSYQDNNIYTDAGSIYAFSLVGSEFQETQKMMPDLGPIFEGLGAAVLLKDDFAFVGSIRDDALEIDSGSVYVYKKISSNWVFQYKLIASDGAEGDYFGRHIVDAGNQVLISARGDADNTGAVYAYEWSDDKWIEVQKITASDGVADNYFGFGLDYDQGRLIIAGGGSGYLFQIEGKSWVESHKLTPAEVVGAAGAISIEGDLIVIGDPFNSTMGSLNGALYTFEYESTSDDWQESDILYEERGVRFGSYLDLNADQLMSSDLSGNIFYYSRVNGKWVFNQIINPPDHNDIDIGGRFGSPVVFNDNRLIATLRNINDSGKGAVYVFDKIGGDWTYIKKLESGNGNPDDWFGFSISMQNQDVLVGVLNDDDNGIDSGSAFFYENVDDTIFNNGFE